VRDDPTAGQGPYRPRDGTERGPDSYRCPAPGFSVRRADEREAARHQERRPHPLDGAGDDAGQRPVREPARHRGDRENRDPRGEEAPATQTIAERAAHEHERGEKQRVRLDDPLREVHGDAELPLHHWQRDIDDSAVEKRHARPEYRHHQSPARVPRLRRGRAAHARRDGDLEHVSRYLKVQP